VFDPALPGRSITDSGFPAPSGHGRGMPTSDEIGFYDQPLWLRGTSNTAAWTRDNHPAVAQGDAAGAGPPDRQTQNNSSDPLQTNLTLPRRLLHTTVPGSYRTAVSCKPDIAPAQATLEICVDSLHMYQLALTVTPRHHTTHGGADVVSAGAEAVAIPLPAVCAGSERVRSGGVPPRT
jgi:hypothetical protein